MLKPKNWEKFQHYKQRRPPWIKLHHDLLSNVDYLRLPDASKALAPQLWLLASEYEDGSIGMTNGDIAFRLYMTEDKFEAALGPLIEKGFFQLEGLCHGDASALLAPCKQSAMPEIEREEETENREQRQIQPSAGADAPADDPKTQLFRRGLSILAEITGNGPATLRSFIGKCLRDTEDNAALVLETIEAAFTERIADPQSWITRRLNASKPNRMSGFQPNNAKERMFNAVSKLPIIPNVPRGSSSFGEAASRVLPLRRTGGPGGVSNRGDNPVLPAPSARGGGGSTSSDQAQPVLSPDDTGTDGGT